jgi:hypothetical protein
MFIAFMAMNSAFAALNTDFISNVEKTLFIYSYKNENMPKRLDRIELNVYGYKNNKLSENQRISEIKKVFPYLIVSAKQTIKKDLPKKIVPVSNKIQSPNKSNQPKAPEKYPILDEMEKKVFNKTYQKENIYARLDRIENKVFRSKSNASLIDRVENLKAAVLPQRDLNSAQAGNNYSESEQIAPDKADDVKKLLEALETARFGITYDKETLENRIARLETEMFNNVSADDPIIDRLERLVAVQQAQPSSKEINQQAGALPNQAFTNRVTQIGTILFILLSLIL